MMVILFACVFFLVLHSHCGLTCWLGVAFWLLQRGLLLTIMGFVCWETDLTNWLLLFFYEGKVDLNHVSC